LPRGAAKRKSSFQGCPASNTKHSKKSTSQRQSIPKQTFSKINVSHGKTLKQ
jgi:hypothetical protein